MRLESPQGLLHSLGSSGLLTLARLAARSLTL
jgi:hypothetical protein